MGGDAETVYTIRGRREKHKVHPFISSWWIKSERSSILSSHSSRSSLIHPIVSCFKQRAIHQRKICRKVLQTAMESMTSQSQQLHSTLIHEAVMQLYKEGLLKLYRGVLPPLLMKTLQGTILFGLQNTLLQQLSPWAESYFPRAMLPTLAGLGTGVVEGLVFTPWRVQSILQNSGNDRILPTLSKIVSRIRSETLANGWYRGFLPTLTRNALGSSLYFSLKDPLSRVLREQNCPPIASCFVSGMISSIVISLPLYPLSVVVANMQAQVGGDNLGVRATWHQLWHKRQRSLLLLYRGGSLVILRSCISWGITTAIYDQLSKRSS